MKALFALVFLICTSLAEADELKVEINPSKPVAGEVFQAYFRIFTDSGEEPSINFSPSQVEVVGKSNQGISTRSVYANGRITVTREITLVYELVASRPGTAWLRDITAQVGNKSLRHPSVSIAVLKEPEVAADVFVMADVPKKRLYVGEGVTIRYYLYSKVPVQNLDVKKYPKLNNFLKRFLQEPDRAERVSVDGQMYLRSQIYAAKLFPEKPGTLKVDSLSLSATYPVNRSGDPFGAFGFSRELKTRTLNSETVSLEVLPLPEPIPGNFTGLVGKHDFELDFGKSRLIVNEPLEIKLTATGTGALENFEAPVIIKHTGIEEFETTSDLKIADANQATKIFDYTFLPKDNLKLPPSQVVLSYLDPESGKYVSKSLAIPEIEVAGGVSPTLREKNNDGGAKKTKDMEAPKNPLKEPLAGPLLKDYGYFNSLIPYLNAFLAVFSVLVALSLVIRLRGISLLSRGGRIPEAFRKGQFNFGEFARWMAPLIDKTGKSPATLIRESNLEEDTKKYFLAVLEKTEKGEFSSKKGAPDYEYSGRHFKKLSRYIENASYEITE